MLPTVKIPCVLHTLHVSECDCAICRTHDHIIYVGFTCARNSGTYLKLCFRSVGGVASLRSTFKRCLLSILNSVNTWFCFSISGDGWKYHFLECLYTEEKAQNLFSHRIWQNHHRHVNWDGIIWGYFYWSYLEYKIWYILSTRMYMWIQKIQKGLKSC